MAIDLTSANREACGCGGCPTYDECMTMEEESLYCGTSVTMCDDLDRQGCACPTCSVYATYRLDGSYYCFAGPVE